jgi:hypothetical protein
MNEAEPQMNNPVGHTHDVAPDKAGRLACRNLFYTS